MISTTTSRSNRVYSNTTDDRHKPVRRTFSLNMSVSQGIKKLGYTAICSIVREMMQISDLQVIQGVQIEDLSFSNEPSAVNFSFKNMLLVIILLF